MWHLLLLFPLVSLATWMPVDQSALYGFAYAERYLPLMGQYQKERSERGVEVNVDEDLPLLAENSTAESEVLSSEDSSRLDRDLELDIDFPNSALNEIGSQFTEEEDAEWIFKDMIMGDQDYEEIIETTTTTSPNSIYRTQFGIPFPFELPPLPNQETMDHVGELLNNLIKLIYNFINVDLIRAVVDLFYDGFRSTELLNRETMIVGEEVDKEEEKIRDLATFVISGMFDKQDCASRAFCELGSFFKELKGSALFFMMAETTIPKDWSEVRAAVNLVERGVKGEEPCSSFQCNRSERYLRPRSS